MVEYLSGARQNCPPRLPVGELWLVKKKKVKQNANAMFLYVEFREMLKQKRKEFSFFQS